MHSTALRQFMEDNQPQPIGRWTTAEINSILAAEVGLRLIRRTEIDAETGDTVYIYLEPEPFKAEADLYQSIPDGRGQLRVKRIDEIRLDYSSGWLTGRQIPQPPYKQQMVEYKLEGLDRLHLSGPSAEGEIRLRGIVLELLWRSQGRVPPIPEYVDLELPHPVIHLSLTWHLTGMPTPLSAGDYRVESPQSLSITCFDFEAEQIQTQFRDWVNQLSNPSAILGLN